MTVAHGMSSIFPATGRGRPRRRHIPESIAAEAMLAGARSAGAAARNGGCWHALLPCACESLMGRLAAAHSRHGWPGKTRKGIKVPFLESREAGWGLDYSLEGHPPASTPRRPRTDVLV